MAGNVCKHLLFVFLKVLRVSHSSHICYQRHLLQSELRQVFDQAPAATQVAAQVAASQAVCSEYAKITGNVSTEPGAAASLVVRKPLEECSVCFDDFTATDVTCWCETGCGGNFHKECIQKWLDQKRRERSDQTCPLCRTLWPSAGAAAASVGSPGATVAEGYVNLANLQPGTSAERELTHFSPYRRTYPSSGRRRSRW